jgi:hypothetical protein
MITAIIKDVQKKYLEAVDYYEKALSDKYSSASVVYYINLSFIYWSFAAQHFEFNIPNDIPDEWSVIGENNYELVINKGIDKYPNSLELHFWKRYYSFALYGEDFTKDDCISLINTFDNTTLVPYFFLYLFDKVKYQKECNRLIEECIKLPTAKNTHIYSFLK